jgi:hypothetical protein
MSYGWKFWTAITIAVCIGCLDAFRQAVNKYLSDRGGS